MAGLSDRATNQRDSRVAAISSEKGSARDRAARKFSAAAIEEMLVLGVTISQSRGRKMPGRRRSTARRMMFIPFCGCHRLPRSGLSVGFDEVSETAFAVGLAGQTVQVQAVGQTGGLESVAQLHREPGGRFVAG